MKSCWWSHDWEKWRVTDRSPLQAAAGYIFGAQAAEDWRTVGETITQERVCKRCGLTQIKTQSVRV